MRAPAAWSETRNGPTLVSRLRIVPVMLHEAGASAAAAVMAAQSGLWGSNGFMG
jgi:hypothetical protein